MGGCKDPKQCDDQHLCKLAKRSDLEEIKRLVKDASYICRKCGRAAREPANLCDPSRL
jgi:hypothetical protein